MADGGNVNLYEIDGLVMVLKFLVMCRSYPRSTMTLKMGIERQGLEIRLQRSRQLSRLSVLKQGSSSMRKMLTRRRNHHAFFKHGRLHLHIANSTNGWQCYGHYGWSVTGEFFSSNQDQ